VTTALKRISIFIFLPPQRVFPFDHDSQLPAELVDLWVCIAAPSQTLVVEPCALSVTQVCGSPLRAPMGYPHTLEIRRREFETIVDGLSDALDFSRTIGVDAGVANAYECGGGRGTLGEVDFYTRYASSLSYDVAHLETSS